MPNKICLQDAREFLAPFIDGGLCATDSRVDDRINEAEELLMQKADWKGTQAIVRMCVNGNCLTIPREIRKVIKARICNGYANVMSQWYQFLEGGLGDIQEDSSGWVDLWDALESPTRFDLPEPAKLLVHSDQTEDPETRIHIRGWDETGREIWDHDNNTPGECVLITGSVGVYTQNKFSGIKSIQKPVTKGYVYLHAFDIDDGDRVFLSEYHPDVTRPQYRRYQMKRNPEENVFDAFGRTRTVYRYHEILALVKFQHVKLTHPSDTLYVESLPALKNMLQAMRYYDVGEHERGAPYEARAEKILLEQKTDFEANSAVIEYRDPFAAGSIADVR